MTKKTPTEIIATIELVRLEGGGMSLQLEKEKNKNRLKKGDKVFYQGAYNEFLEESAATVLKVNRKTGLVFIEVDYPAESDSGNPCEAWVHPCQLKKLALSKKGHN